MCDRGVGRFFNVRGSLLCGLERGGVTSWDGVREVALSIMGSQKYGTKCVLYQFNVEHIFYL